MDIKNNFDKLNRNVEIYIVDGAIDKEPEWIKIRTKSYDDLVSIALEVPEGPEAEWHVGYFKYKYLDALVARQEKLNSVE